MILRACCDQTKCFVPVRGDLNAQGGKEVRIFFFCLERWLGEDPLSAYKRASSAGCLHRLAE